MATGRPRGGPPSRRLPRWAAGADIAATLAMARAGEDDTCAWMARASYTFNNYLTFPGASSGGPPVIAEGEPDKAREPFEIGAGARRKRRECTSTTPS